MLGQSMSAVFTPILPVKKAHLSSDFPSFLSHLVQESPFRETWPNFSGHENVVDNTIPYLGR